ncbi:hypothetical protein CRG98_026169 [Punica granatum]|uniref:Uncharacterized protein n=1 Tax=Punica granatum TaxID=22663 RepID=A0A2I0JB58_PUNGR|nr:hypothetical protein CRG98_026169 [Punica granatum]
MAGGFCGVNENGEAEEGHGSSAVFLAMEKMGRAPIRGRPISRVSFPCNRTFPRLAIERRPRMRDGVQESAIAISLALASAVLVHDHPAEEKHMAEDEDEAVAWPHLAL